MVNKSYVVVGVPARQMRAKDEVVSVLLKHCWRLGKVLPLESNLGDIEVIFRKGHDAGAILALLKLLAREHPNVQKTTHVFGHQVGRPIIILEETHVSALTTKRPEAAAIGILATNTITRGDSNAGILIVLAINMQVQDILAGPVVVDNLGPLDNALRAKVTCLGGAREEGAFVLPLHKILGGVAVDVLEVGSVCLVLTNHVVSSVDLTVEG